MSNDPTASSPAAPVDALLELIRRARSTDSPAALRFIAVNDTHLLAPYQQSVLWTKRSGVQALSGLIEVDANVPYVQWLNQAGEELSRLESRAVGATDLSPRLGSEWSQWLPPHALWIRFGRETNSGGFLFARELPWSDLELRIIVEWIETWSCLFRAHHRPSFLSRFRASQDAKHRVRNRILALVALATVCLIPVRQSVLAPGELVPANPTAIRAPLEGVIKTFFVKTNQAVKAGDPLFAYDDVSVSSKLDVATEALRTAETEFRQLSQLAVSDPKARAALPSAKGEVEEKRLELEFLRSQLDRNQVNAPKEGVAFVDDPAEWLGRPVVPGERILRLAEPEDKEIEAWLSVSDAIVLPEKAPVRLYLSSSPLNPVPGELRLVSYEAQRRPDGSYAYRVRATLTGRNEHRIGLKGTVRLSGERVPLIYWMLRRPLAAARSYLGI